MSCRDWELKYARLEVLCRRLMEVLKQQQDIFEAHGLDCAALGCHNESEKYPAPEYCDCPIGQVLVEAKEVLG